jgi:hypothetical protein
MVASQGTPILFARLFFVLTCTLAATCQGQQPFVTDDADVTPRHRFHFEFSNQFDLLQRSAFPNLKQNNADMELDFGVLENFELGVEVPFITIINSRNHPPRSVSGLGDINLSAKYNFMREGDHSSRPAMAITVNLELPTGNVSKQLGSGLVDFDLNGVLQKSLTTRTKIRLNGGVLFSGNETTGVLGVQARGTVFTASGSITRQFSSKLLLGIELAGAKARNSALGKAQLLTQVGGNYQFAKRATFDFGIVAGKYPASPRLGAQAGVSIDF